MNTMGERIKKAREEKKLYQADLAAMIGVKSAAVISNWEKDLNKPDADKMVRLCESLNISLSYLLDYYGEDTVTFSNPELKHIKKYRALDEHGKKMVDFTLNEETNRMERENIDTIDTHLTLESRQRRKEHLINNMGTELQKIAQALEDIKSSSELEKETDGNVIYLQRSYNTVAAAEGSGTWLDDQEFENVRVILNDLTRKADMILNVQGRSMEPDFRDGDQVLVMVQPDILNGEVGVFMIDNEGFLKQKAADRLVSLNPDVPDIYIHDLQECRCIGKVIGKLDPNWIVAQ